MSGCVRPMSARGGKLCQIRAQSPAIPQRLTSRRLARCRCHVHNAGGRTGPECSTARTARRCERRFRVGEYPGLQGDGGREIPVSDSLDGLAGYLTSSSRTIGVGVVGAISPCYAVRCGEVASGAVRRCCCTSVLYSGGLDLRRQPPLESAQIGHSAVAGGSSDRGTGTVLSIVKLLQAAGHRLRHTAGRAPRPRPSQETWSRH
jgi:hypothetical protein